MPPTRSLRTLQYDEYSSERRYSYHKSMVEVSSGLPDIPFVRLSFLLC